MAPLNAPSVKATDSDNLHLSQVSKGVASIPSLEPVTTKDLAAVSVAEMIMGFSALGLWFILFGGGILVGTEDYRKAVASPANVLTWIVSVFVVLSFWTITNIGILACLSAFLGAFGRRTRFAILANRPGEVYVDSIPKQLGSHYASAIIRGFAIYGMVLAGLLVLATETFEKPSVGGYSRLAATISTMAFYAGYDPELFASMLQRVKRLLATEGYDNDRDLRPAPQQSGVVKPIMREVGRED